MRRVQRLAGVGVGLLGCFCPCRLLLATTSVVGVVTGDPWSLSPEQHDALHAMLLPILVVAGARLMDLGLRETAAADVAHLPAAPANPLTWRQPRVWLPGRAA